MSKVRIKITYKERKWFAHIAFREKAGVYFAKQLQTTLFFIGMICISPAFAQDLRFTQFHASDTWLNPAFAGIKGQPRVEINIRDQWPSIPQTYMSYRVAFDVPVQVISSGVGLFITKDDQGQGALQTMQMGGQFNYQMQLGRSLALNAGLQVTYTQQSVQWEELQFFDQINPVYGFTDAAGNPNPTSQIPPPELQINYMDFAAGALVFSNTWYAGVSVAHLTQPEQNFFSENQSKLPMAVTVQTGLQIMNDGKSDPFIVNPVAIFTMQKDFKQAMAGSYFKKGSILAGAFAKYNFQQLTDISALVGMRKGWTTFAYSYDIAMGSLQGQSGGAHELSVVILFEESSTKSKTRRQKHALDCPGVL